MPISLVSRTTRLALLACALGAVWPANAAAEADDATVQAAHPPAPARIEPGPCPFAIPPGEIAYCMTAWVPESHGDADDPDRPAEGVGINLVLLGNFIERPDPDPLVFLSGGPGQAGSSALSIFGNALEIRRNRGILLVDQRGTGASEPRLDCPQTEATELDDFRLNDPDFDPMESVVSRLRDCHADLVARAIDLSAFDTRSAALDLKAIRTGLGLNRWNLLGTSYGTRVALDALRVDPEGIRSVILNSTLPTSGTFDAVSVNARGDLFEKLYESCAADKDCHAAFPALRQDLEHIAAHLEEAPLRLYLREPASEELRRQEVGWNDVLGALYKHMAFTPSAAAVPRYIHELAQVLRGRANLNDDEVARIFQPGLEDVVDELAMGMHLSVRCREDFPLIDDAALNEAYEANAFYYPERAVFREYRRVCPFWDVGEAEPDFGAPVSSDVPVLMLAGDADPLTPIQWARQAKAGLSNARLVTFRGMAHDIFDTLPCARAITANFLDAPGGELDTSCAEGIAPAFGIEQD